MKKGELRAAISRGYREMSELTKVKCGGDKCPGVGNRAYRCCDRMHCQMTIDHAYKDWGIRLPSTGHQLPLMGPTGCTALPHLRGLVARIGHLAARGGGYRRVGPFLTPDRHRAIQNEPR